MSSPTSCCPDLQPCPHPQVNQKLQLVQQGKWVDDRPDHERSPSPEPYYNEAGARINTRDYRAREKLHRTRNVSSQQRQPVAAACSSLQGRGGTCV
jgi:hypothetical protein